MSNEKRCPYCGGVLEERYAELNGRRVFFGWGDCHCDGAESERARIAAEAERRMQEQERRELESRCRMAGIGERYLAADHPEARSLADAMIGGCNVYFYGPVGTGKTWCAAATARAVLEAGHSARFIRMTDVMDSIRRSYKTGEDVMTPLESVPYLFIDDIGKESPTSFVLERIFALIDARSAGLKRTCVTSQYSPASLGGRLSQNGDPDTAVAIVSRLMQNTVRREFKGKDRRA